MSDDISALANLGHASGSCTSEHHASTSTLF